MSAYFESDPDDEPTPGYFEWEQWWMSLTADERAHEVALMDRYVGNGADATLGNNA